MRNTKKTVPEFVVDAKKIHGDKYDYSLVNYKNTHTKVEIGCHIHGIFEQSPNNHIDKKQGCPKCGVIKRGKSRQKTIFDFVVEASIVHNNKYDYSLVDYNGMHQKVKIVCPTHGEFSQLPMNHLKRVGCPRCKLSKGETAITNWLEEQGLVYIREYRIIELGQRRFDFFLPDLNIAIEFDGIQHFYPYDKFGGQDGFNQIKESDNIKTQYCTENDITLIRVPYWKINKIPEIMNNGVIR